MKFRVGGLALHASLGAALIVLVSPPVLSNRINDTGITTFGDDSSNNLTADPGGTSTTGFPGQDASFGRDAASTAGTLKKVGGG